VRKREGDVLVGDRILILMQKSSGLHVGQCASGDLVVRCTELLSVREMVGYDAWRVSLHKCRREDVE
jgi:hypothetical protein